MKGSALKWDNILHCARRRNREWPGVTMPSTASPVGRLIQQAGETGSTRTGISRAYGTADFIRSLPGAEAPGYFRSSLPGRPHRRRSSHRTASPELRQMPAWSAQHEPRIVINPVLLQERHELLLKRHLLVMFRLRLDVPNGERNLGRADGEGAIPFLPATPDMMFIVQPFR